MADTSATVTRQVRRVSHITLIVDDQDASIDFYNKVFGTEIRSDNDFEFQGGTMRWVTIGIPGDDLEIAVTTPMPGPDGRTATAGDGNMTVVEAEDVEAVVGLFQGAGGTVASEPEDLPWGRSAVVRDPDGNPWNIVSPTN